MSYFEEPESKSGTYRVTVPTTIYESYLVEATSEDAAVEAALYKRRYAAQHDGITSPTINYEDITTEAIEVNAPEWDDND